MARTARIDAWFDFFDKYFASDDFKKRPPAFRKRYAQSYKALLPLRETDRYKLEKNPRFQEILDLRAQAAAAVPRNAGRIAAAKNQIDEWVTATRLNPGAPLAFEVVRRHVQEIGNHLKAIVDDPLNLNQADYPICGANAFLHSVAVRQPDVYVDYVLALIKHGNADIKKLHVEAPSEVREKEISQVAPLKKWDYAEGRRIDIASWVATASLRASENPRGYKSMARMGGKWAPREWHAGIKGMSSLAEIKRWFTKAGHTVVESTDNTKRAYLGISAVDADALLGLGKLFGEYEIILLVNSGQIRTDDPSQRVGAIITCDWRLGSTRW